MSTASGSAARSAAIRLRDAAFGLQIHEFPIVKTATLDHYHVLYRAHTPSGQIVRLRTARPPEAIAGSYTPIILSHAQSMASAFNAGLYASGFALLRPILEALFKQGVLRIITTLLL